MLPNSDLVVQTEELSKVFRVGFWGKRVTAVDGVNLEVSQSYLSLAKAKEKISYAIENRDQAKENYRVTNEKFKAGMVLNSELVDAESVLLIANINYISSIVEYKLATAKLEKAIGK